MIILGADLATSTGICFGRPDATPTARAFRAPVTGADYGEFGGYFWRSFSKLIEALVAQLDPNETLLVCYEAPILPQPRFDPKLKKMVGQTSLQTTRKLHSLGVILETVCALYRADLRQARKLEIYECHVSSLKKELGGHGAADKASMVFAARRAGISLPEGKEAEDAADAFAAWLIAVRIHARQHQQFWDKRLHSAIAGRLM